MCWMFDELPMHLSLSKGVAQEVLYDSWGVFFAANVFLGIFLLQMFESWWRGSFHHPLQTFAAKKS